MSLSVLSLLTKQSVEYDWAFPVVSWNTNTSLWNTTQVVSLSVLSPTNTSLWSVTERIMSISMYFKN